MKRFKRMADDIAQALVREGFTVHRYDAEKTDDLYFKASANGETYTFVIEYYLCNEKTEVYEAVRNLKVGDTIDLEGFLYWYEGAQPHITSVTVE